MDLMMNLFLLSQTFSYRIIFALNSYCAVLLKTQDQPNSVLSWKCLLL